MTRDGWLIILAFLVGWPAIVAVVGIIWDRITFGNWIWEEESDG